MKPITLEDFYNDPDFYGRVERAAQRERALAVRGAIAWLFGGVGHAFGYVKARLMARPERWIERLG